MYKEGGPTTSDLHTLKTSYELSLFCVSGLVPAGFPCVGRIRQTWGLGKEKKKRRTYQGTPYFVLISLAYTPSLLDKGGNYHSALLLFLGPVFQRLWSTKQRSLSWKELEIPHGMLRGCLFQPHNLGFLWRSVAKLTIGTGFRFPRAWLEDSTRSAGGVLIKSHQAGPSRVSRTVTEILSFSISEIT